MSGHNQGSGCNEGSGRVVPAWTMWLCILITSQVPDQGLPGPLPCAGRRTTTHTCGLSSATPRWDSRMRSLLHAARFKHMLLPC